MGVARFYMILRYRDRLVVDEQGDELASEHAVHGHTARDLIANGRMDSIRTWSDCSFEVVDGEGRVVLIVPSAEAINEEGATRGQAQGGPNSDHRSAFHSAMAGARPTQHGDPGLRLDVCGPDTRPTSRRPARAAR